MPKPKLAVWEISAKALKFSAIALYENHLSAEALKFSASALSTLSHFFKVSWRAVF